MGFYNSTIKLRPDGLFRATIRFSYLYFYTTEVSESFKTLGEARTWLLEQRCPQHIEEVQEEVQEEEKIPEIQGNAFENDSDEEAEISDSEPLNNFTEVEEKKKKPKPWKHRNHKKVRWKN